MQTEDPKSVPTGTPPGATANPEIKLELTEEQRALIVARLNERQVTQPCPRCQNKNFNLISGLAKIVIQPANNTLNITGQNLPAAITTCTRCGFVALHSLGFLGFDVATDIKI